MRYPLLILLLAFSLVSVGQKKDICISIDDLPVASYGVFDTIAQKRILGNLITSLKKNKIPAIGFVNEDKLHIDTGRRIPFEVRLLSSWVNSGLALGNHTYSHPDYNTASYHTFTQDIVKGETVSKELLRAKHKKLTFFRHPFLHIGTTRARADSLNAFLSERGYIVAPVTIDNEDYAFALAYFRAKEKKDSVLMGHIGRDYITYMDKAIHYFEKVSTELFKRNISQILLIHASMLNSDYMDALAAMFRKNGYDFISMEKTLKDPAYKSQITVFGIWGNSWLERWAMSQGRKGEIFQGSPAVPEYVRKIDN